MCGFTITKNETVNKLTHRGTESTTVKCGDFIIEFNSLPLSSNGTGIQQPIKCKFGYLVFNGEIFNYKDLMPNVPSDVHYLKKLFNEGNCNIHHLYKESMKWDGFWSIAYISNDGDVKMFTDWLGKKQLYYSNLGIASEIKPILPPGFMLLNYDTHLFGTNNTPFDNVYRCIPGKLYLYSARNNRAVVLNNQNYWIRPQENNLYSIIDKSVEQRLENKIDGVSLFLSGGLDSNIVLHHLLKRSKDFEAISIYNQESEVINAVEQKYGINVKFIEDNFSEEELVDAVYRYEHSLDYGSLMANYLLFKNCSNSMVLTGDGSDELFGGYTRALTENTWDFDVNKELPYYHNIRLDRTSMAFTKEARSPLMSMELARYAYYLPRQKKIGKNYLRETYSHILPKEVIEAKKKPLRLKNDKEWNRENIQRYFNIIFQK